MQALKALVIILGVLILAASAVVAVTIYNRATDGLEGTAAGFGIKTMDLPPGAEIVEMTAAQGQIVLRLRLADGSPRILVVDLETGEARRGDVCESGGMRLVLTEAKLRDITTEAAAAYPEECCGLLVGRRASSEVVVTRTVPSPNLAVDESGAPRRADRFEVDPELRLAVMRECEGTVQELVGHYHSHPDHPARPSVHDLDMALEPELVWLIIAVANGKAGEVTAHVLDETARRFREIPLRVAG